MQSYASRLFSILLLSGLAINVGACSDGGGGPENHKPAAKIAAIPIAVIAQAIKLDGSGSTDQDGDKLTYAWSIKSAPAGSTAKIDKVDAENPSFTPDKNGDYSIGLVVSDGKDKSDEAVAAFKTSQPVANHKPVANAGAAEDVAIDAVVTLDGSKSSDADPGDKLTYAWTLAAPATSKAVLDKPTAVGPTFKADVAGKYVATLIVSDGKDSSDAATVTITASAANHKPVAVAGGSFVAKVAQELTLDASKSTDADKDTLTFAWTLDTAPTGSAAALKNPATATPAFTPDKPGSYFVSLVADDGKEKSDKVSIEIVAEDGTLKPIARILPPAAPKIAVDVALDGSGSLGPKAATLTYAWTLKAKPTGSTSTLASATLAKPTFKADLEGKYTFELKVNDGTTDSDVLSLDVTFAK